MLKPLQTYLDSIEVALVKKCGRMKADDLMSEIRQHLEQTVTELINQGLTQEVAAEQATATFGDVDCVVRWYGRQHQRPSVWRASLWPIAALALVYVLRVWGYDYLSFSFKSGFGLLGIAYLTLFLVAYACYRSRRFVSGVIVLANSLLYFACAGYIATQCVPLQWKFLDRTEIITYPRASIPTEIQKAKQRLQFDEAQLATYQRGMKAFAASVEPASGVGEFHDSKGYLSQIVIEKRKHNVVELENGIEVDGYCQTYKDARNYWINQPGIFCATTGKKEIFYLAETLDEISQDRYLIANLPLACWKSFQQRLNASLDNAKFEAVYLLIVGLVADGLGGSVRIGIAWFRRRRRTNDPLIS